MLQVTTRCAIYTRKSTDEGLEREFNTLDAQREAAEAYIQSQRNAGWVTLVERYDDGGFTGGNTARPGLQRLLADIKGGGIDCVVVYKVDRLSRSLLDFSQMVEVFDQFQVAFVAVTQQINTASSAGRLMLNVLLSFAQFERELISERTRDKMGAARRKGKWLGSAPVLGYDADRAARRLTVNQDEAERVRQIFRLYLDRDSMLDVVRELRRRGWSNKAWTTKQGRQRGGREFTKGTLHFLLSNVAYLGKVSYRGETYEGEHEAILANEQFAAVQAKLTSQRNSAATNRRVAQRGRLAGKLFCGNCQSSMVHTYTTKGRRRYRYYECARAKQTGTESCRNTIPAAELEAYVRNQALEFAQRHDAAATAKYASVRRIEYDHKSGNLRIDFQEDASEIQ